jgi:cell division septation protein DedD
MDNERPNNTDPDNHGRDAYDGAPEGSGEGIPPDAQPTQPIATPPGTPPPGDNDGRQRWIIGGVLAFVLAAALLALLLFREDDDNGDDTEAEEQATEEVATETAMAAVEPTATVVELTATPEPEPTETEVQATEAPEPDEEEETEVAATETAEAKPEPTETEIAPTETAEAAKPTATKTPEKAEPTQEPKPTGEPKPTATEEEPEPTPDDSDLAYEADWSSGSNGWNLTGGWAIENGQLTTTGNAAPLLAPFEPQRANYAVEMTMTITGLNGCDERVGVFARVTQSGKVPVGYAANVCDDEWHIDAVLADDRDSLANGDRPLESGSHDYRIEVAGERIRLYIDDEFIGAAADNRWNEAGRAGIYVDGDVQVTVSAFRVFLLTENP